MRELNIAYGNSCMAKKWSNKTVAWEELAERLKTTIRTTESVEEYKKMKRSERENVKDKGGFVGGHLTGGRRKRENVASRSMLTMDVDNAQGSFIESYTMLSPYASILYTTHSHTPEEPRVRILVPLTRDVSSEEYQAIARYFAAEWGIDQFDECSYRPHQLMYWPTTPANGEYVFKEVEGEWLDPDIFLKGKEWKDCSRLPTSSRESEVRNTNNKKAEDPLTKGGVVGAFCRAYGIDRVMAEVLSDVYEEAAIPGRYQYKEADSASGVIVYDNKFAYSFHASDPACGMLLNSFDLVRVHRFGDMDEKKSFQKMAEWAVTLPDVKVELARERDAEANEDFADEEDWKKNLTFDKAGKIVNTLDNLLLILENDPQLQAIAFNQLSDGMEIRGQVPWKHPNKYWRDQDDAQLVSYIELHYGKFSARYYDVAVTKVADDRSYHPIKNYLASLPPWDGVPRVDTLLIDYLGAKDNEYVRAVTRKTLCAAVKRVMEPGCKFDTMLVMNGPQGIGKSTLIQRLAGEWFCDSVTLNEAKDKTAAEKLQGYWIHEIGELAGMRKAEVETLRSFLSRQNDVYRAAFGKRATPHLRQCIFFGTTNAENGYLRDTTGNRRFWPVKTPGLGEKASWELKEDDVKQIWAETLVYVEKGESLILEKRLAKMAEAEQRDAMESDEREGIVKNYLETLLPENWDGMDLFQRREFLSGGLGPEGRVKRKSVCNMEVWCECYGRERSSIRRADSNEITLILKRLGWVKQEKKERVPVYGPQYCFVFGG
ncbi:MAG: hypothetical protein IJV40_15805 [Oscillospiraceae bacterium]|nr:hypothetical protein [Oscillospiraceae bacterium]